MAWLSLVGVGVLAVAVPISFLAPMEIVRHGGLVLQIKVMLPNGMEVTTAIPLLWRAFALAVTAVPTTLMIGVLIELFRLFKGFAGGCVFDGGVLIHFRRAATLLFWSVIAGIPAQAAIFYAMGQAKGQFWLGYLWTGFEPVYLFAAGVLLVISRVMAEAQCLAEENAKFV
jgi:hypothetical protein